MKFHTNTLGGSYYARLPDGSNTAVAAAEGGGLNQGEYTISDAALVSAGFTAPGQYVIPIHEGVAGSQSADDPVIMTYDLVWSGSVEITTYAMNTTLNTLSTTKNVTLTVLGASS